MVLRVSLFICMKENKEKNLKTVNNDKTINKLLKFSQSAAFSTYRG